MSKTENENKAAQIIERRAIYYPAFELYEGSSGFYDYGPIGLRIKRNIEATWRRIFIEELGSMEIQTTDLVPEIVLKASGHVSTFTDPIINCKTCKSSFRADKLLEEHYEKKNDEKALGELKRMGKKQMEERIKEHKIRCQKCGGELAGIEDFNLMFKTHIGQGTENVAYLRPETAQGIFVDFKNLYRLNGLKLPCAIAQVGKAYRNEISPRQQLVRMREFHQMETELFLDPDEEQVAFNTVKIEPLLSTEITFVHRGGAIGKSKLSALVKSGAIPNRYFAMFIHLEAKLLTALGFGEDTFRFREIEKEELPHYSKGNVDLEIKTSYGWIEVAGNAYRTDWDLSQHAKLSEKEIKVISGEKSLTPHVVEASIGLDRLLLSLLDNSVDEGKERGWNWLKLMPSIAPYRYAIFPLQKDEKLESKAHDLYKRLIEKGITCYYSTSNSIGKRYAKADEIGVPYAITFDFQTIDDGTVTIRDRDTTKQIRKKIDEIEG